MIKRIGLLLTLLVAFTAANAGAVAWVSPSGQAAGPTNGVKSFQGMVSSGGGAVTGSLIVTAIGTPSAPTMSTNGTAGSTTLTYACTALDINGNATIPSATATITTANATLTAANSVNVTCGGQVGAIAYLINKADTAHVIGYCYTNSNVACTFVDTGTYVNGNGGASQTSSFTYTANTIDKTGGVTSATSGASTFKSFHSGSSNAVVSNSATGFIPFDGTGAQQATNEGDVSTIVSNVATVKNLKCVLTTAPGVVTVAGGTSYAIALDQNLSASAVTCTIATAASSCTDTTHSITTAVGDQLDYLVTPTGTPTALVVKCSAETDL